MSTCLRDAIQMLYMNRRCKSGRPLGGWEWRHFVWPCGKIQHRLGSSVGVGGGGSITPAREPMTMSEYDAEQNVHVMKLANTSHGWVMWGSTATLFTQHMEADMRIEGILKLEHCTVHTTVQWIWYMNETNNYPTQCVLKNISKYMLTTIANITSTSLCTCK